MTQQYDPGTGTSTYDLGQTYSPELIHAGPTSSLRAGAINFVSADRGWNERWDNWARSAIASGSLVPPVQDRPRTHPAVVAFLLGLALLGIVAPWLIWGAGR